MINFKLIILFTSLAFTDAGKVDATKITNPFPGTWKHVDGNTAFIVSFWIDNNGIMKGHYKKVLLDNNGNQISVIYNSKKYIGSSITNWPHVIYAGSYDGGDIEGGKITDNTVTNTRGFIDGDFKITINPGTSPLTASWQVKKSQGLREPGEPDFNIPTDIVLTKVSNVISLD